VKFLRFRADEIGIDRQRMALLGVSSGAYLAAMAVLRRNDPEVMDAYRSDPQHGESGGVEVAIAVAGTFDNISAWEHDQLHRPDRALEAYLGGTPTTARRTYYHASPMFYADAEHVQGTRWLLAWGMEDDVVDPGSQSVPFSRALKRAGGLVRTCPVAGTGHYWLWHADGELPEPGLESGHLAARVRVFLRRWSGWDN
jgi:dipeptidyl aminopeptidase/acylaminoacyl peptidase